MVNLQIYLIPVFVHQPHSFLKSLKLYRLNFKFNIIFLKMLVYLKLFFSLSLFLSLFYSIMIIFKNKNKKHEIEHVTRTLKNQTIELVFFSVRLDEENQTQL